MFLKNAEAFLNERNSVRLVLTLCMNIQQGLGEGGEGYMNNIYGDRDFPNFCIYIFYTKLAIQIGAMNL